MNLHSPDFHHNSMIPAEYTCDGDETSSPTLIISEVPEGAKSLVLIMDDPDAEMGRFLHWIMWNISPMTNSISSDNIPDGTVVGYGSTGKRDYVGPCPPKGTHHYEFHLYAINRILQISEDVTREELEEAIDGNVLEEAKLVGIYSR